MFVNSHALDGSVMSVPGADELTVEGSLVAVELTATALADNDANCFLLVERLPLYPQFEDRIVECNGLIIYINETLLKERLLNSLDIGRRF